MGQSLYKNISIFKRKRIRFVDERKWFEKDTCVRKYFWIGKNNFWILKIRIRVDGTPITDCFACQVWLCFILFLVSTLITSAKYFFRRLWWWFIWRSWVELIMRYVLIACERRLTCACSGPRKSDFSSLDGGSAAKTFFLEFAEVSLLTGLVLKVSVFVSARAVLIIFYIGKLTHFLSVLA